MVAHPQKGMIGPPMRPDRVHGCNFVNNLHGTTGSGTIYPVKKREATPFSARISFIFN
jgi:hypothetical protein